MWRKLNKHRQKMFDIMSRQQEQNQEEVVARKLIVRNQAEPEEVAMDTLMGHGKHFVLTELVVRSKEGKLADGMKKERGGSLGLNWSAQNTGSLARLVMQLEEKVKECGGSVRKHKLVLSQYPPGIGAENKLWMARKLKESFLATQAVL